MSSLVIVADESVDFRIIQFLREQGYDIIAIVEESPSITDAEVLRKANDEMATLLTEDKDFGELTFRLQKQSYGVVLLRLGGVSIERKLALVLDLFSEHGEALATSFTVLTEHKVRIRPISSK
jgi:predicted nuclease of predicted toxin-antitoxin system